MLCCSLQSLICESVRCRAVISNMCKVFWGGNVLYVWFQAFEDPGPAEVPTADFGVTDTNDFTDVRY